MRYVLGVDAGGTKTVGLLADEHGAIVSTGRGRGANLQTLGAETLAAVLAEVIAAVLPDRAIQPAAICLGVAGADREVDHAVVREIVRQLGLSGPVRVLSDAAIALAAGVGSGPGVVLTVGTGSMAYGQAADGRTARAGGWGHILGDEGSGYWIGRRALRAAMREADGRGPYTAMTPRVLAHFGVGRPDELIYKVYRREVSPADIAALAHAVHEAHQEGDGVATALLDHAARELLALGGSVIEQLRMQAQAFAFILAGGMFEAAPRLAAELTRQLPGIAPHGQVQRLAREPAEGAVRVARGLLDPRPDAPAISPRR